MRDDSDGRTHSRETGNLATALNVVSATSGEDAWAARESHKAGGGTFGCILGARDEGAYDLMCDTLAYFVQHHGPYDVPAPREDTRRGEGGTSSLSDSFAAVKYVLEGSPTILVHDLYSSK